MSNMANWNRFVQSVMSGAYKDDKQSKDIDTLGGNRAKTEHIVDVKKGADNNEQK